jgi:hypothetical protein
VLTQGDSGQFFPESRPIESPAHFFCRETHTVQISPVFFFAASKITPSESLGRKTPGYKMLNYRGLAEHHL